MAVVLKIQFSPPMKPPELPLAAPLSRADKVAGLSASKTSLSIFCTLTPFPGGSGSTVVEGTVNEFARVTVNGASAQLSKEPAGDGFRYRRTVPVTSGSNTVTVQATDQGGQTTTKRWQFTVPAATRTFSYDANGNTLSDGPRTMTWDVKNRLRSVTKGGTTWKWDYDHADRRVKEYENNTLTKIFIWSGTSVVQERNATGTITRTHYSGGFSDGPIAASGTKYQLLTDHLGHVREIVDASGAVVTRYDYTSYQGPVKLSGTLEATFQTIGRYYHHAGSGLELALYRAYDPELGRWLNEDPLGERGGLNLYGYVGNGPVMAIDPLGLDGRTFYFYDGSDPGGGTRAKGADFKRVSCNGGPNSFDASNGFGQDAYVAMVAYLGKEMAKYNANPLTESSPPFIERIVFNDHGNIGQQFMGTEPIAANNPWLKAAASLMPQNGRIALNGCSVALGTQGENYLQQMANETRRSVQGYNRDITVGGGVDPGGELIVRQPQ